MPIENGGGEQGGVISPAGLLFEIFASKERKPFSPFGTAERTLRAQGMIATLERKIAEAAALGNPASRADLRRLVNLNKRIEGFEQRFRKQVRRKPERFIQAGIQAGSTLLQVARALLFTERGQRIAARFFPPDFFNLAQLADFQTGSARGGAGRGQRAGSRFTSPIPTRVEPPNLGMGSARGGRRRGRRIIDSFVSPIFDVHQPVVVGGTPEMPFMVQAAPEASSSGGFGGFFGNLIRAGGEIGSAFLRRGQPSAIQPFPGPQQASLVPFGPLIRPIVKGLPGFVGGVGTGAVGGELADLFQDLFSGGASTLDDSAAFTDPVPGHCHPKTHVKVNPCTGKGTWFTPRGRALLFSGDIAAVRRVDRISKRMNKALPRKHGHAVRHSVHSRKR